MTETIKSTLDALCSHLVFDEKLLKKVNAFRIGFMTKNESHVKFFGGNLTGVELVRFTSSDEDTWCDEILGVSELVIEKKLRELPTIIVNFKVSSDTLNNTFIWMMHRFLTSPNLNKDKREQGAFEVAMIMNCRYLTSRLWKHFKYQADPEVAAATYMTLSRKFALKQHGNWQRTLEARSRDIIDQKSIHYKTLISMNDDIKVREMINDTQGRIRSMIKNIMDAHVQVHASGTRISSTSSVLEHEGEQILKDKIGGYTQYYRYLLSIIPDKRSFIKPVLTSVIIKAVPTMPDKQFYATLNWICENVKNSRFESRIEKIITDTVIHAFNYLYDKRNQVQNQNDIINALSTLKGAYSASRSTDPLLLKLREEIEDIASIATKTRHKGNLSSVRTGILLYIVLRAMTRRHFTN